MSSQTVHQQLRSMQTCLHRSDLDDVIFECDCPLMPVNMLVYWFKIKQAPEMPLPATPDTALAMVSRLLLTTTIAALSSTCWTVQISLRPTRLSHQTNLPSQVWWRLACHLRIPDVGQLTSTCLGISKLLRQLLINDFWPTAESEIPWRTPQELPTLPFPPVFLRPRRPTPRWPESFLPSGFPRNPYATVVWAGQPWKWNQVQRQQWRDIADAQATSFGSPPVTPTGHSPLLTHGFLTHRQFSWHPNGTTLSYARERYFAYDVSHSDDDDSQNSSTD
jgi:hypothetical protein